MSKPNLLQKLAITSFASAISITTIATASAHAVKMTGSFKFTGESDYCSDTVSASAHVMIFKIKDDNGNPILDPNQNSTIQFSSPEGGNCYGKWESLMIPITEADFGSNWIIESLKFIGYAEPKRDPDRDPPTDDDIAYMTGFLDFMNMSGIIHTLLDDDRDEFGTTLPMNTDPEMQNTLDPGDERSDTTTAMLPKPEDLEINKVPEPTSSLGLLALSSLGVVSIFKHKKKL